MIDNSGMVTMVTVDHVSKQTPKDFSLKDYVSIDTFNKKTLLLEFGIHSEISFVHYVLSLRISYTIE